jgi:hypothetical protein
MHITKLIVYGGASVLAPASVAIGLSLAPATLAGTWVGARLLDRMPARVFVVLVEAGLVVAGALLIIRG